MGETKKLCNGCKWWRDDKMVLYGGGYHECAVIQGGAFQVYGNPIVYDGEGQLTYAFLATPADFGCNRWEGRE